MNRTELFAYLVAAMLGGAIAGYAGGLIGILAVFIGLGLVGFAEMVVLLNQADAKASRVRAIEAYRASRQREQ